MTGIPLILVAEDEESDVILLRRAFHKAAIANPVVVVRNGRETIHYLNGTPPFTDRVLNPLPALLLLDLNMPVMDGFHVLAWLQGRPDLKQLPVVVLSSSDGVKDQEKARSLGALDYIVKTGSPHTLIAIVQALHARWLKPAAPLL